MTLPEWQPSAVVNFEGFKVGVVGFSNADLTSLIFPRNLDLFVVTDAVEAVNREAASLREKEKVNMIIGEGHEGATSCTFDNPTGLIIDLADILVGVNAVLDDHTDFQTITTRPNGILITENRSRGVRFTRVRLVVDTSTKGVIYKTADFHKPWNIGIAPDLTIQARIDELNSQLGLIFNTVIGESNSFIPRSDACGHESGKTVSR